MKELGELAALIGAIGVLLTGIASFIQALIIILTEKKKKQRLTPSKQPQQNVNLLLMSIFFNGISLALLIVGFLIIKPVLSSSKVSTQSPSSSIAITSPKVPTQSSSLSVEIINPRASQQIEVRLADTGSGSFTVSGTSAEVFTAADLRVYVLVHPAAPFADGWWIQRPATVDKTGEWTMLAWIGGPKFPPHVGDNIEILVVAANPNSVSNRDWISDPKNVNPAAQSNIVRISIGSIMR